MCHPVTAMKFRTRGGAREGAGRPRGVRPKVAHREREALTSSVPYLVTIRLARRNLRNRKILAVVEDVLRGIHREREGFRVTECSIQEDHLHLIVEGDTVEALASGFYALNIRLGKRLNQAYRRQGRIFADRHHRKALRTPSEVRNAKAYVLLNRRRHLAKARRPLERGIDPFSSGIWFRGWTVALERPPGVDPPVAAPGIWLTTTGWRRRGLISPWEIPGGRKRAA